MDSFKPIPTQIVLNKINRQKYMTVGKGLRGKWGDAEVGKR